MDHDRFSFDIANPKFRQFRSGDNVLKYTLKDGEIIVDWVSGKNVSSMIKAILSVDGEGVSRISGYVTDKLGGLSNRSLYRFADHVARQLGGNWTITIETVRNRR